MKAVGIIVARQSRYKRVVEIPKGLHVAATQIPRRREESLSHETRSTMEMAPQILDLNDGGSSTKFVCVRFFNDVFVCMCYGNIHRDAIRSWLQTVFG